MDDRLHSLSGPNLVSSVVMGFQLLSADFGPFCDVFRCLGFSLDPIENWGANDGGVAQVSEHHVVFKVKSKRKLNNFSSPSVRVLHVSSSHLCVFIFVFDVDEKSY